MTAITTLPPLLLASVVLLALVSIGVLIWTILPRRNARERDIERQIATLRKSADHAVSTRPRVRAGSSRADHIGGATYMVKPKPCGGGLCRHRADCADHHCPGRSTAKYLQSRNHAPR